MCYGANVKGGTGEDDGWWIHRVEEAACCYKSCHICLSRAAGMQLEKMGANHSSPYRPAFLEVTEIGYVANSFH